MPESPIDHEIDPDDQDDDKTVLTPPATQKEDKKQKETVEAEQPPGKEATKATPPPPPAAPPSPVASPPTVPAKAGKGVAIWLVILTLIVFGAIGAGAYGGWLWWQDRGAIDARMQAIKTVESELRARMSDVDGRMAKLDSRISDQSQRIDQTGSEISATQSKMKDSLTLISKISEDVSGGRKRFQLAAIEHLLLIANDRLLLEHDPVAALAALDSANERLGILSDPQLFEVRKLLAEERTELRAVAKPDIASASLLLKSLIDRVSKLKLISHAPAEYDQPEVRSVDMEVNTFEDGWRRLVQTVKNTVVTLFTIRKIEDPEELRLLPTEVEAVVYNILRLKLEGARVALLRRDTVAMREQLRTAGSWLEAEFRSDDAGVQSMLTEIQRLKTMELSPPLPDITRSHAAMRKHLEALEAQ